MKRVEPVDPGQLDPAYRDAIAHRSTGFAYGNYGIYAHQPEMAIQWLRLVEAYHAHTTLPRRLTELVRLRIAYHNQCPHCMAARFVDDDVIDEGLVCSLELRSDFENNDDIAPEEAVALRWADLFASNHLRINDELFEELHKYFSDAQIVELGMRMAIYLGFGRLSAGWALAEDYFDDLGDQARLIDSQARRGELRFSTMPTRRINAHR